jgi:hypothetical protein
MSKFTFLHYTQSKFQNNFVLSKKTRYYHFIASLNTFSVTFL